MSRNRSRTIQITITNDALRRVFLMKIQEEGDLRRIYTRNIWFREERDQRHGKNVQTVKFFFNATDRIFNIIFIPKGRTGGWATIDIVNSE